MGWVHPSGLGGKNAAVGIEDTGSPPHPRRLVCLPVLENERRFERSATCTKVFRLELTTFTPTVEPSQMTRANFPF